MLVGSVVLLVCYHPLASCIFACGIIGYTEPLLGLIVLFLSDINCRHGSFEVALPISLSTAPPALTQPLPVSQPAAAAVALAETAAAVAFPLALAATVALTTATAAPVAVAAVALAATALAEPAPRHAPTTTTARRRAGQ